MMHIVLTLLLNKWNYTPTDELETLNIDLTLLATEYPRLLYTIIIRIAGYFCMGKFFIIIIVASYKKKNILSQ